MKKILLNFVAVLAALTFLSGCVQEIPKKDNSKIQIFVSILPQKYFVERIAGDNADVFVMVKPGASPTTYEPNAEQMLKLATADLYFRIGVPFEEAWMKKLTEINPNMQIIDTRKNINLRKFNVLDFHLKEDNHNCEGNDPHIWLSPELVKIQAQTIFETIAGIDVKNRNFYQTNLKSFQLDLEILSQEIKNKLAVLDTDLFMVFHPAWGYFAYEFGLKQIAIEVEGKNPVAQELAEIIDFAKANNVKVIFVQEQFSALDATAIAEAIDGYIVYLNPLAEDYLNNLKQIAHTITAELKQ